MTFTLSFCLYPIWKRARATLDARKAADEARTAGEKAAEEVMKRLRKLFLTMAKDITEALDESRK